MLRSLKIALLSLGTLVAVGVCLSPPARAEVMLQLFNVSWKDIAEKMPELAEVGYRALWLPPPAKGSGGLSVGYDHWDPFDLGSKDQRNTVRTRYGTEAELLHMIEVAHRYGIRVYFDNIMNHRAFDVPGFNEFTSIEVYPGMYPEDFHLQVTEEGFYRKWDNVANWGDTWQVQNRNFSDLIDIAQETPNVNHGENEGDNLSPKLFIVRHPGNPEYYDTHPTLGLVGFNSTSITAQVITDNENFYQEDTWLYLMRSVRWFVDRTRCDGLRLDAVKHVPSFFFGADGAGAETNDFGYTGQAQRQFNRTRGFSDANHRDSAFNTEIQRDDLIMFGEHLGEPPGFGEYISRGMRLMDAPLHGHLNSVLGFGSMNNLDQAGFSGNPEFNQFTGVTYVKSHDDDYASRPELQFAFTLTRAGLPNVYSDGNFQSETLGQSGGAFPRHANINYLGQFADPRVPNLVHLHENFSRSEQRPLYSDNDYVAYSRVDKRENGGMSDQDGSVMLFMMNDNYAAGQGRSFTTTFSSNARLWQYALGPASGGDSMVGFYYTLGDSGGFGTVDGSLIVPRGGYFIFSWRVPEESRLWESSGGAPITIQQNMEDVGVMSYERTDGPDGDPGFNPFGVPDPDTTDFAYTYSLPRVTDGTNLRFVVRTDGSAENILVSLDGGWDVNSHMGMGDTNEVAKRDNPPGIFTSTDVFLGYEQPRFLRRILPEKFAARNTASNSIGSAGAETYIATIGAAGFNVNDGDGDNAGNDYGGLTIEWAFHDPETTNDQGTSTLQFTPAPEAAVNTNVCLWVKVANAGDVNTGYVYYTTDGSFPEGAGGEGRGATRATPLHFDHLDSETNTVDWWKGVLGPFTNGTTLIYKVGMFRDEEGINPVASRFPDTAFITGDGNNPGLKQNMMTTFEVADLNAATLEYIPHNDYGNSVTGLVEGFHVFRARAFLERLGKASLYETHVQPFYYDTQVPEGEIVFPVNNGDTLVGTEFGAVVRTDPTVSEIFFHIDDSNPGNDDGETGNINGNGTNALGDVSWAPASQVTPELSINNQYPDEWRFTYRNLPSGGSNATITVRLLERSSSSNLNTTAAEAHQGELVRQVFTSGTQLEFFYDFPTVDGAALGVGYVIRVYFSDILAMGIDDETLRNRFIITLDDVDGVEDPVTQGKEFYNVNRFVPGGGLSQVEYALQQSIFNSAQPDQLYDLQVKHTNGLGGGLTLTANRMVKGLPEEEGPFIDIIQPPEFDSDGKPFEIFLPDLPEPVSPSNRQFNIRVETGLDAKKVWLSFDHNAGEAGLVTTQDTALSGTVSVVSSNPTINGAGTDFNTNLSAGTFVKVEGNLLQVDAILSSTQLTVTVPYPGVTTNGVPILRADGNPTVEGSSMFWNFLWTNITEGMVTFHGFVNTNACDTNVVHAQATRNTRVIFRQTVNSNTNDLDDDDDGLFDTNETMSVSLPPGNAETWQNGEVHVYHIYGFTDPLTPDTDNDGLPDGLESGWRGPDVSQTDTNANTNGTFPNNFRGDLDPPFYNTLDNHTDGGNGCTVPGVSSQTEGGDRAKQINGSVTDPNNPDTDGDGILDGVEDKNANGWVDGNGTHLDPSQDECTRGSWPSPLWTASWQETDPNKNDSDDDGATDGFGEDTDFDGAIAGDVNSNRVHDAGELWTETDPLNPDTDGDGLPDGWEKQVGLDPFDDGVVGHTNLQTGGILSTNINGASGNPDDDVIVVGGSTNQYTNIQEFNNGTHPFIPDTGSEPPPGEIVIGPRTNIIVVGGISNAQIFTDWNARDCLALDEYEGDGNNDQQGDVHSGGDGFDSSRDIVAFYARDGGDNPAGGDFYFRLDFFDLQTFAEQGNQDIFIAIDTGSPATAGEMAFPFDLDTITSMRWEVVVAAFESDTGSVFVDPILDGGLDTTGFNEDLVTGGGVEIHPEYFLRSYYNSELDSVEIHINRKALIDSGWNGNFDNLNFQVFTAKDGTLNSPPGPGDIGGRSDIRDSILDDFIAEDDFFARQGSDGEKSIIVNWIPSTSRFLVNVGVEGTASKVAYLMHGNQHNNPGNEIQDLINDNAGSGYFRPLDVHEAYNVPFNLHLSPTLAQGIEWAKVDPGAGQPWRDGPAFNDRLATLISNEVVHLLGATYSEHILPYFDNSFNQDNELLARDVFQAVYQAAPGPVFWPPERVLDNQTFGKVSAMGYSYSVIDQMIHLLQWIDRTTALGNDGYRLNRFNGVNCFVVNDFASTFRFQNTDTGLSDSLRRLFSRKARSGTRDQVVVLLSNWEDFGDPASAGAHDLNVRWIANRPWIQLVTFEQIVNGEIDLDNNTNTVGESWVVLDRGSPPAADDKKAHDFIHHATEENYDNWYDGSGLEEGLRNKVFDIRTGVPVPGAYGSFFADGILSSTWSTVNTIADSNLLKLARATLHASVFETAFHENQNNDLSRFSTGDYVFPDGDTNNLIGFSKIAQAQTRMAAIYERVDDWAGLASFGMASATSLEDIDLDGEDEMLLFNGRLFGVFERMGARLVGVWARDIFSGEILQMAGNFASFSGSETEEEGELNVDTNGVVAAHRTSLLKDWFAQYTGGFTSVSYINDTNSWIDQTNGWRFTSADGKVTKKVTLETKSWQFDVEYDLLLDLTNLTVRNGFSPNLCHLILHGQASLSDEVHAGGVMSLNHTSYTQTATAYLGYGDGPHNTSFNNLANDDDGLFTTVNMRNQAQTHQTEVQGSGTFRFSLGFRVLPSDFDGDGMPNTYEDQFAFLDPEDPSDATNDFDGDGVEDGDEYIAATAPNNHLDYPRVDEMGSNPTGLVIRFETKLLRDYFVDYANGTVSNLMAWARATSNAITGTGLVEEYLDQGPPETAPHPFDPALSGRVYRIDIHLPR